MLGTPDPWKKGRLVTGIWEECRDSDSRGRELGKNIPDLFSLPSSLEVLGDVHTGRLQAVQEDQR